MAALILSDGTVFEGQSFGANVDSDGEVVFNTGMAGYVESLSDPSYRGQILTFTYPLIGNYGVPSADLNEWGFSKNFESEAIHVRGVICAQVSEGYSHHAAVSSLQHWMEHHGIPGITGIDTRALTKKLREYGVMLGRIVCDDSTMQNEKCEMQNDIPDPNVTNLVAEVSCSEVITYEPSLSSNSSPTHLRQGYGGQAGGGAHSKEIPTVIAYDCGIKRNILRSLLKRGVRVVRVPWDFDLDAYKEPYHALFFSNGPGDPKRCTETIAQVKKGMDRDILTFGICLGNQLLALAIGGDTFKLKYGHRGCNQPCIEWKDGQKTDRCIITSQNHGFAVDEKTLPNGWSVWFTNGNDGSVEGIRHESGRFFSVQFHPEATPGPEDAGYLFDEFVRLVRLEMDRRNG